MFVPYTEGELFPGFVSLAAVVVPQILTLSVSPVSVSEDGLDSLIYLFSRSGSATNPLTVNYTVAGTAALGNDYTGILAAGTTKTVTFLAGSSIALVTVKPTADTTIESNETVALTLAPGLGYTILTTAPVVGTIRNDDLASVTLAVSPAAVLEDGSANLRYTFSRSGATTSPLTVKYTVSGTATLGSDYTGIAATGTTKTVTFAAGASTALVTVNPSADVSIEPNETVILTLAGGTGYTRGTTTAVSGTITTDDVSSFLSATLAANQSTLLLAGTAASNGTGNSLNNTITGNSNTNRITGLGGADSLISGGLADSDVFVYSSLADSRLSAAPAGSGPGYDTIQDFNAKDRLSGPASLQKGRLVSSKGLVPALTPAAIASLLTPAAFAANTTAAFTSTGFTGSFIAMNDGRPGFQAGTDAILFLRNYSISATNAVEFI
jgi:hypothetical protein